MKQTIFQKMITELCSEMKIKVKKLSYDWVLEFNKNGENRHIVGSKFDLNSDAASTIASDKYATYEVLKNNNVPVIKHTMLFNPKKRKEYTSEFKNNIIIMKEKLLNKQLVVKPNEGREGLGVYLCNEVDEVKQAVQSLFKEGKESVSLCPYYKIKTEYRTFYLNGQVLFIYGKQKPYVIGDGTRSVSELIKEIKLPNNKVTKENLKSIDMNYVPRKGEKQYISWKHNLSGGATASILEKGEIYDKIEKIAIAAGKAININFATVDVILTEDDKIYVIEINSTVGTTIFSELAKNGYEQAKDIYRKALKLMLDE